MILDWGKDNAAIPMSLNGWVWGPAGGGLEVLGSFLGAGKVSPSDIAMSILYREMADDILRNMRDRHGEARKVRRERQEESYRIISDRYAKMRETAGMAILLAEG